VTVIDSDQHLYEYRGLWAEHIDPEFRDDAIHLVDDELGHVSVAFRDRRLGAADVQLPGETDAVGERRQRERDRVPPAARYDDALPADYWDPAARIATLDQMGIDEAMVFPNFGLLWERVVGSASVPAMLANMRAWNRWCEHVVIAGRGRVHPVAHLALNDLDWLEAELVRLERDGIRAAMIAPALVDGRRLSHPDLDRAWSAFERHGVSPLFHVADQPRIFGEGWYPDEREFGPPVLDSVFLYAAAAVATTDLIINATLERHPDLRIGIVELSAVWVPMYLMMLDGGARFIERLNGHRVADLRMAPSEYFLRQVRVSSFAYELPVNIKTQMRNANVLMCCSDYPHSEGTATPLDDYARGNTYGVRPTDDPEFFGGNAAFLLATGR
jgi:hypothetical protein